MWVDHFGHWSLLLSCCRVSVFCCCSWQALRLCYLTAPCCRFSLLKPFGGPPTVFRTLDLWAGILGAGEQIYTTFHVFFVYALSSCLYLLVFSNCFGGLGGLSGGAWGRLGDYGGVTWAPAEHLGRVKRKNDNMRCDMIMCFWKYVVFYIWFCRCAGECLSRWYCNSFISYL